MSYQLSKAERELSQPGRCTRCGAWAPAGRNTAGRCTDCHNLEYREYRDRRRQWLKGQKAAGREYWRRRGIVPGDRVKSFSASWIGFGGVTYYGTAKIGAVGAYVHIKGDPAKYQPQYWEKA